MQKVNKDLQEYYNLREAWGKYTSTGHKVPREMIVRLEELKKIIGKHELRNRNPKERKVPDS